MHQAHEDGGAASAEDQAELPAEDAEIDELDEQDEDFVSSESVRGRKRARSVLSASSESEGQSRSRRRRSTPPADVTPDPAAAPGAKEVQLYLPKQGFPPTVRIVSRMYPFVPHSG